MAIYEGSRYTNTPVYNLGDTLVFKSREYINFNTSDATIHTITEGETLDGLAYEYYGDSQLWWVILEANPKYVSPNDIRNGDPLIIPSYDEISNLYLSNIYDNVVDIYE